MGVQQPGKAPGPSAQQIERQLQMIVNDALKVLDASTPTHSANQAEVDSLRSLIWSELTGLEAEFGREGGPRADRIDRFFHHLLSSGDYVGQIESLGSALLGGEPPPSQPAPGSPVAELHQLHSSLTSLRKQWQQTTASSPSQPTGPARPSVSTSPAAAAPLASNGHTKQGAYGKPAQTSPRSVEPDDELEGREWRPAAQRAQSLPARRATGMERLFRDLGFGNFSSSAPNSETEPPLPRALITFVVVIVILALFGVGVIYLGLSGGPNPDTGTALVSTQTVTIPTLAPGTPSPTATLSAASPQLVVQGNNLPVPCANSAQTTGFTLQNAGGQILNWTAKVNPVNGTPPVSLSLSSGQLYGEASTNTEVVTVTALVNTSVSGTITVSSNAGSQTIQFHVLGC
jgi:hypothetical protein